MSNPCDAQAALYHHQQRHWQQQQQQGGQPPPPQPALAVPTSWPVASRGRQRQDPGSPPLVLFDLNGVLVGRRWPELSFVQLDWEAHPEAGQRAELCRVCAWYCVRPAPGLICLSLLGLA